MRLNDLREVTALSESLKSLNKQIDQVFYLKFDDNACVRFLNAQLQPALARAKKELRAQLVVERNRVIQSLRRLGVTFDYE